MNFNDKVILITGGSSGIGANSAVAMSKLGGNIVIVGRNESKLNDASQQIKAAGSPRPFIIVADVTTDAERIINETIQHFGKINVLVNNAGISLPKNITDSTVEDFDRVMNTNLRSVVVLTKLCVPHLQKTRGNIINISSIAGSVVIPSLPFHSIAKAGINLFTQSAAVEFGAKNIRINAIAPGIIDTPIFETIGLTGNIREILMRDIISRYPIGRIGTVDDVTNAIIYSASDLASFVTGTVFRVDGGAVPASAF